jgi:hypothetical protein
VPEVSVLLRCCGPIKKIKILELLCCVPIALPPEAPNFQGVTAGRYQMQLRTIIYLSIKLFSCSPFE